MAKKTSIKGRMTLVLDSDEIFPDDPGQGTPAVLYIGKQSATYWCAMDTGAVDEATLTDAEWQWLDRQSATVDQFLKEHGG